MLLTRIGKGSKMVITGDIDQQDRESAGGLSDILSRIAATSDSSVSSSIRVCRLTTDDVRRDPLVKEILALYTKSTSETVRTGTSIMLDELREIQFEAEKNCRGREIVCKNNTFVELNGTNDAAMIPLPRK